MTDFVSLLGYKNGPKMRKMGRRKAGRGKFWVKNLLVADLAGFAAFLQFRYFGTWFYTIRPYFSLGPLCGVSELLFQDSL